MRVIKLFAICVFAVGSIALGACSSKKEVTHTPEQPVTYGYSK